MGAIGKLAGVVVMAALAGCTPWPANIELRKENQKLQDELAQMRAAKIASQGTHVVTTQPGTAGAVDLDALFTVSSLSFGRLTMVDGQNLRVFVTPQDAAGDELKTLGSFEVLAYDLAKGSQALVGQWTFTPEQARAAWNGKGLAYGYVLDCPIKGKVDGTLSLRVTYRDLLTGRQITGETQAKLRS